jgi:TnpA family transposase
LYPFGLCDLLGCVFRPSMRDLKDQQLSTVNRAAHNSCLALPFRGGIASDLTRKRWDQLVRGAASPRHRTAPAYMMMQPMAGSSLSDRFAKALTALGWVVKTIHILRYLHDEQLWRRVQRQLKEGSAVMS